MAQLPRIEAGRPLATVGVRPARRTTSRRIVASATRSAAVTVAVVFTFPVYWMLISGLKTQAEIFAQPIVWWPRACNGRTSRIRLTIPASPSCATSGTAFLSPAR